MSGRQRGGGAPPGLDPPLYVVLCLIVFGCQYQCNWLPGKTRLRNVSSGTLGRKPYTLAHSVLYNPINPCPPFLPFHLPFPLLFSGVCPNIRTYPGHGPWGTLEFPYAVGLGKAEAADEQFLMHSE